jgi:hypothetical protein
MPPVALIQEIGAYAGLVALPAFVVLAVLHLSQARDVRRLREWAGRAPERDAQRAAAPRAAAVEPRPAATPPRPPASPATAAGQPDAAPPAPPDPSAGAPRPGPSTAAATAVRPRPAARRPAWADDEHLGVRRAPAAAPSRLEELRSRVPLPLVGAAAGLVLAVVLVVVLTSGGSSPSAQAPTRPAAASPSPSRPASVAVLNATSVAGLGHQIGARVEQAGYRVGAVGDAPGRQGSVSVVMYAPGGAQAAQLVAHSLGVTRTAPADASTEAQAHGAAVIVIVGADMTQAGR